jgi:putative serine protease PepD
VQEVKPGSPAAKAGIRGGSLPAQLQGAGDNGNILLGGDIITGFDGKEVTSGPRLAELVAAHKPGEKVDVVFLRKGQKKTVRVTLGKQPANLQAIPAP